MRTLILIIFFCAFISVGNTKASVQPTDSIGVEKIDGKIYVIHVIEEKETLYALSRRYGASVSDIIAANPTAEDGLDIGQRVRIPLSNKSSTTSNAVASAKTHEVAQGETLFSISRKYNVNVADIKKWNELAGNNLEIGQKLILGKSVDKVVVPDPPRPKENSNNLIHVVKQSETLFSISRTTGVSVSQIKEWNNLEDNSLSIGQQLIVGVSDKTKVETGSANQTVNNGQETTQEQSKEDPFATSRVEETDESSNPTEENTNEKTTPTVTDDAAREEKTFTKINKEKDTNTDFEEVVNSGIAELIEGSVSTRKYLALHRTAKIGTIMRVRNEMNGQEVFVRVLGKLPDTDINENVLIKISKAAYNRLGAIDQKFRVSISYIP